MIDWLIEHYAEIAVYSSLTALVIGVIASVALGILKYKEKKSMIEYLNRHRHDK